MVRSGPVDRRTTPPTPLIMSPSYHSYMPSAPRGESGAHCVSGETRAGDAGNGPICADGKMEIPLHSLPLPARLELRELSSSQPPSESCFAKLACSLPIHIGFQRTRPDDGGVLAAILEGLKTDFRSEEFSETFPDVTAAADVWIVDDRVLRCRCSHFTGI